MPMKPAGRLALVLALVSAGSAGSARAQSGGDTRQQKAKQACAAGRVEEGVEILAALYAESGDVNYVYNQGRCYQQNGRVDQALNRFHEYLRRATSATAQERQEVQGFIDELERQRERAAAPGDADRAADATRAGRLRKVGLTAAAVGAVAVATGVVLSLKVRSSERDVEQYVRDHQPLADPVEVASKMRAGGRLETFQWVAYGAGVAALAAGVSCYLLGLRAPGQAPVALSVAPGPHALSTTMTVRF
jgi:hypothetical protein